MAPSTSPYEIHPHCHHVRCPQVSRRNGRVAQFLSLKFLWQLFRFYILCIHSPHAGLVFILTEEVLVDPLKL